MSHDPVKDALAYAANARAVLANAVAAIEVIEAAVRRIGVPSALAWVPASEFRGEPGTMSAVWRSGPHDVDRRVRPMSYAVHQDGSLGLCDGLVSPIPDPPPLPDAPPALTPPGAWVPCREFRGEAKARVWLAVAPGKGADLWPLDVNLEQDGRLHRHHLEGALVCLVTRPEPPAAP